MTEKKAVRKVLESEKATTRVVAEYVKSNPVKNDTVVITGPVMSKDTTIFDTTYISTPYEVLKPYKVTETRIIEKVRTDTVKVTDRTLLDGLSKQVKLLSDNVKSLESEVKEWKGKARERLWAIIAIIALVVAIAVFTIKVRK